MRIHRALESIALAAVLALGAILRLGWPGVNSFSFDEARVSLMALKMARGGEFARLGMQSSTGIPNFPAAVWIFALPYRLSTDPLVATLFVGLLGTLAVAGLWWLARRAWGPWAALSAALLFAASPFAVLYSRSIWSQDLLPPLAVLWALAGVVGVSGGKSWALATHVFLAGFAFQVHYAGLALLLPTAWLGLRYRLWQRWRAVLIGGALAVLAAWPFLHTIWCCAPGVQADLQRIWQQPTGTHWDAFPRLGQMAAGADWEWLLLGGKWRWEDPLAVALGAASLAVALLVGLGLVTLAWQAWRDRRDDRPSWRGVLATLVPLWAFSASLVFLRSKTPVMPQYQLAALPALFLAAGAAAGWARRPWGPVVTAVALAVALTQAVPLARGLGVVAQRLTPGGLGTPLARPRAATQALKDGRPIVVHAHGDVPEFFGDAAGFSALLWGYPHRIVDGRSALIVPGEPAHLLMTFASLPAWQEAQASGLAGEARSLPRREGEPPYVALRVEGANNPSGFQPVEPLTLANGARLQGWRVRSVNGQLRVTTWWQLVGPLTPGRYHQFNHLRSAERLAPGTDPLAGHDVPLSSHTWQEGDTLVTWADFDGPTEEGPFWVDVGMYTWPEIQRSPVLDRPGDPLAPIRLGPFAWPDR